MSEIVVKKKKKKVKVFPIVNAIIFILISLIILVPMWKVIVDSFDARAGYGMLLQAIPYFCIRYSSRFIAWSYTGNAWCLRTYSVRDAWT